MNQKLGRQKMGGSLRQHQADQMVKALVMDYKKRLNYTSKSMSYKGDALKAFMLGGKKRKTSLAKSRGSRNDADTSFNNTFEIKSIEDRRMSRQHVPEAPNSAEAAPAKPEFGLQRVKDRGTGERSTPEKDRTFESPSFNLENQRSDRKMVSTMQAPPKK